MRVVRKVLLAKKEPLYILPNSMCFHLAIHFPNLPKASKKFSLRTCYEDYLQSRGIEQRIDFTMGPPCQIELHIELT
ncbi:hypothetical protein CR513_47509, partial [Mucuna pruriens]